jgi:hypothetical protein
MNTIKFKRKIASQGTRKIITVPTVFSEMLNFEKEYLVTLKPIRKDSK